MKYLNIILKILAVWIVISVSSALLVSIFSCFVPYEYFKSYFEDGFYWYNFRYFKLTLLFYLGLSSVIAFPGFILNAIVYIKVNSIKYRQLKLVLINMLIGISVLFIYFYLNISSKEDFWKFIFSTYMSVILISSFLLMPKKSK